MEIRAISSLVLGLVVALSAVAAAQDDTELPSSNRDVYERVVDTVAWVSTDAGQGTGFLLSRQLPYVITNEHVVRGQRQDVYGVLDIYFPVKFNTRFVVADEFERVIDDNIDPRRYYFNFDRRESEIYIVEQE